MRMINNKKRISLPSLAEIARGVRDECERLAEEEDMKRTAEDGRRIPMTRAHLINYWLCDMLSRPLKERDAAARRGRDILDRLQESDKPIPFDLQDSADPAVAQVPKVRGLRGRVIGEGVDPGKGGSEGPDAKPVVQDRKRRRP